MKKVIVYISNINEIGGVETATLNFCKHLRSNFEITLLFEKCLNTQLLLDSGVHCEKIDKNKKYYCDTFVAQTCWGYTPHDQIIAKKYIQVVHADYSYYIEGWNFKYLKHPKTTHHVCVGKHVSKMFEKVTAYKCDKVIYNLLNPDFKQEQKTKSKQLRLITCSRISQEKGFCRMLEMAERLKGTDYIWNVYGDETTNYAKIVLPKFQKYPNIHFHGVTTKAQHEINKHDYLVQLSDSEGMPYAILEALQTRTAVITTDYTSAYELINCDNGLIIKKDLSNFGKIEKPKELKEFKGMSNASDWMEIL